MDNKPSLFIAPIKMTNKIPVKAFIRLRPGDGVIDHSSTGVSITKECGERVEYNFDGVFGPTSTQYDLFNEVKEVVKKLMEGYNSTIFCYGNTGAGKTYTMVGNKDSPGLIYNLVKEILKNTEFIASYLEIYNEKIYDLLEPKEVVLREFNKTIIIPNLTNKRVKCFSDFEELFLQGTKNRTTGETKLNKNSSRSHAILRISVGDVKMYLIDLAGSEDNRKTGNEGIRLAESNNINRSLFVLGKVVNSIIKSEIRIPYRDSKLTRLLQDSLGGSSLCYIIANVIDAREYMSDTINTLLFASKSRNIFNNSVGGISRLVENFENKKKVVLQPKNVNIKFNTNVNVTRMPYKNITNEKENIFVERMYNNKMEGRSMNCSSINKVMNSFDKMGVEIKLNASKEFFKNKQILSPSKEILSTSKETLSSSKKILSTSKEILNKKGKNKQTAKHKKLKLNTKNIKTTFLNTPDVLLSPKTKEKSYKAFLKRAKKFEEQQKYKQAIEDYKTIQKFCNNDFIRNKIEIISSNLKNSKIKKKLDENEILGILNSGNFFNIKKLSNVGDKRAQTIVDFIGGGNHFETIEDLKLVFTEKICYKILGKGL